MPYAKRLSKILRKNNGVEGLMRYIFCKLSLQIFFGGAEWQVNRILQAARFVVFYEEVWVNRV